MFLHKPAESLGKSETEKRRAPSYKDGKQPSVLLCGLIIAVTLTAIAVTIFLGQRNHHETVRLATEQFNRQQLILARSAGTGIETFMADVDDDLLALSNFAVVQRMEPGILERMEVLYTGIPTQTSFRRLDKNGILRFIYPNEGWRKDLIGRDYSQETFFQNARETGEVAISGLIINEAGQRRIRIARPVCIEGESGDREFNGVIVCSVDPSTMSKPYVSPIVSGETRYAAWLLNEDGIFLAHYEEAFVGRDAFKVRAETNPELSYVAIDSIQRHMMAGEEGVSRYVSGWHWGERGIVEKFIAYTPVHVFDKVWSMAVCAPVDEVKRITSKAYRDHLYALAFAILILTATGAFFFVAFYHWTRSLRQEIERRRQAEERIVHLNAVLRAIRNVNQVITKVKDRQELLQGSCDSLIETRGYHSAWIAITEKDGRFATAAHAGVTKSFPAMIDKLKSGELTPCLRQAFDQSGVMVVAKSAIECGECPLVGTYVDKNRMIAGLEYEGRVYGFLTVTAAIEMPVDEEEQALFGEVAEDIAFALHTIEVEAERKRGEEELKKFATALEEARNNLEQRVEERTRELKEAHEALVRKERLAVLGQLASSVGHELRNPLGVIKNACYFLNMKIKTIEDEAVKENIKTMNCEIDTANQIITDLLDFVRIKAPVRQEVDINQLVKETLSRSLIPEDITVITDLAEHIAPVFIDPVQVGQVFLNLTQNAVQAMGEGGSLKISTRVRKGAKEVVFVDEGCGIPESNLGKIFEPLFTTKAKGIGLGLAVSKSLAEENRGTILVESEEGKGSRFTVRF
ncbi:MAG: GAF domain-containing protein [Deltaproteobacteria bacterium]|nr:GAF domain-containing protein [Deltaproteobacteria bacterium]